MAIDLLLIDDHAGVRAGLRAALCASLPVGQVVEASSACEGLARAEAQDFDVAILDLTLPDMHGLEALRALRSTRPRLPVVIFTMHTDREYCVRCLRAGAQGYVTKDSAADEITRAVSAVTAGRRYVSAPLADEMAGARPDLNDGPTHREGSDRNFRVQCRPRDGQTAPTPRRRSA